MESKINLEGIQRLMLFNMVYYSDGKRIFEDVRLTKPLINISKRNLCVTDFTEIGFKIILRCPLNVHSLIERS